MVDVQRVMLLVEEGDDKGKVFYIEHGVMLIGRGQAAENRLALDSPFISRSHAEIRATEEGYILQDMGSSNGTNLNGNTIEPGIEYSLKNNDLISLAQGVAVLRFREVEGTAMISSEELEKLLTKAGGGDKLKGIVVDDMARDVWVDGERILPTLSLKDFDLLTYLYQNRGKACSKDEIAKDVWKDELVTGEQIDQCIRRLRKKVEPDPLNPKRISTLRGFGYKLDPEA
ncbi:winged helix-turn-helix domain-containing protein [Chloroflexota bacterium]